MTRPSDCRSHTLHDVWFGNARSATRLIVAALTALCCISLARGAENETAPPEVHVPTVTTVEARRAEVVSRISVSGTLVAREEVLVNPQIDGYAIDSINVDIGDTVKKGDVLAVLDDSALQAQLAQAKAELARSEGAVAQARNQIDSTRASKSEADAAFERTQSLARSGNASQATLSQAKSSAASADAAFQSAQNGLDVAKAQVAQAQSQKDLAEVNLERARIKAPVAGIVSTRNAKLGAIAAAGSEPMFRIIRDAEVELAADVIESDLGRVDIGDPAQVSIAGGQTVGGKVRLIAPTVDQATRLGTVRVSLDHDGPLRTGTFASGWIVTDRHMAVTVPATAVLSDATGTTVDVVEKGTVHVRKVVAGLLSEDGRREIVEGLKEGETVLGRAGAFFGEGDKVEPVPAAKPSDEAEAQ